MRSARCSATEGDIVESEEAVMSDRGTADAREALDDAARAERQARAASRW